MLNITLIDPNVSVERSIFACAKRETYHLLYEVCWIRIVTMDASIVWYNWDSRGVCDEWSMVETWDLHDAF